MTTKTLTADASGDTFVAKPRTAFMRPRILCGRERLKGLECYMSQRELLCALRFQIDGRLGRGAVPHGARRRAHVQVFSAKEAPRRRRVVVRSSLSYLRETKEKKTKSEHCPHSLLSVEAKLALSLSLSLLGAMDFIVSLWARCSMLYLCSRLRSLFLFVEGFTSLKSSKQSLAYFQSLLPFACWRLDTRKVSILAKRQSFTSMLSLAGRAGTARK